MFDQKQSGGQGHFGLQMSDTVKNSYIHVFPDRQDLVNPPIHNNPKYRGEAIPQHYFVENYYGAECNHVGNFSPKNFASGNENEKSREGSRILPTSILEDSGQSDNASQSIAAGRRSQMPRASSDYQSYARAVPKSKADEKKSLEDFSVISGPKKATVINLDESDDMSFAQVIKTLEKNIERSKAARRHRPLATGTSKVKGMKLLNIQKVKNQDDTLSLDQSSGILNSSSMRLPTYPDEPKDLRMQFLKKNPEDNNTIYYSFASTDNYDSFNVQSHERLVSYRGNESDRERRGNNNQQLAGSPNSKTVTSKGSPNKLELARIEEEISSIRTPVKKEQAERYNNIEIRDEPSEVLKGCKNCFSSAKHQKPRNMSEQFTAHIRQQSNQQISKDRVPRLILDAQPSENLVLCINCNDLLPSASVDAHSKYCNENMLAQEELKKLIEIEPENLRLSLEKCNLRLKKFKILLEKNLWNLKGQISLGLVFIDEPEVIFSDMGLALQIIDEIVRNQKLAYKLSIDMKSVENLKEDLLSYIDVTLVSIILGNLEEALVKCREKKTILEFMQKQDSIQQTPLKLGNEIDESTAHKTGKKALVPKVELERLRFSSLTSPQSMTSNNPIFHSHKPSFPTNYSQSTRGSTTNSRRAPLENRFLFSGEMKDWIDGSKKN